MEAINFAVATHLLFINLFIAGETKFFKSVLLHVQSTSVTKYYEKISKPGVIPTFANLFERLFATNRCCNPFHKNVMKKWEIDNKTEQSLGSCRSSKFNSTQKHVKKLRFFNFHRRLFIFYNHCPVIDLNAL